MPVVGVAVGVLVIAVVGVVPLPVFVELPPQAARITSALRATMHIKMGLLWRFAVEIPKAIVFFKSIFYLSFRIVYAIILNSFILPFATNYR